MSRALRNLSFAVFVAHALTALIVALIFADKMEGLLR